MQVVKYTIVHFTVYQILFDTEYIMCILFDTEYIMCIWYMVVTIESFESALANQGFIICKSWLVH